MTKLFQNAIEAVYPGNDPINSQIPAAYDMNLEDFAALAKLARKNPCYVIHLAFLFGFVMGNRATITRKLKRL